MNITLRIGIFSVIFTQMVVSKRIKEFGERAIATMSKECKQMEEMIVFSALNLDNLASANKVPGPSDSHYY